MDRSQLPSLNGLKAFEASGRHLNFRRAAEELSVTQGAVSQQVRALEEQLRRQLFTRHARGLSLTTEGREYFASITKAFEMISEATDNLSHLQTGLTISTTPSFAAKWLMPRLDQLTAQWSGLDVRLMASEQLSNFQRDGVDIAIRQGRPPFGPGLVADVLFASQVYMVCSPSVVAQGVDQELEVFLASQPLVHDSHGLWPKFLAQHFPALLDQRFSRSHNFSQTSLALDAAIGGQGVALMSDPFALDAIKAGLLVRLSEKEMATDTGFYILTPRRSKQPELTDKIRGWLLEQADQMASSSHRYV